MTLQIFQRHFFKRQDASLRHTRQPNGHLVLIISHMYECSTRGFLKDWSDIFGSKQCRVTNQFYWQSNQLFIKKGSKKSTLIIHQKSRSFCFHCEGFGRALCLPPSEPSWAFSVSRPPSFTVPSSILRTGASVPGTRGRTLPVGREKSVDNKHE